MMTKLTKRAAYLLLLTGIQIAATAQIKPTTADERLKSFEKKKQMAAATSFKTTFKNIGPSAMSGRVVDVDVNPADPTEFYVAYATGGLWYTVNNGQSFVPIFDSANVIGLGDVAVHWPTKTIWLGTGEANSSRSSYSGVGVYKSTNNGKSWDYLGLPETHHIGEIIVHPTDPNKVWVASLGHLYSPNKERGVYKTSDGGKTWKQTLFVDEKTGAVEMDINPKNPDELYVAMWYKTRSAWNFEESGKTSGIYKSTDGGNSWALVTGGNSGFPQTSGTGRIGMVVSYQNPNVVYAVLDNQDHLPDTGAKKVDSTTYVLRDFEKLTREQFADLDSKRLDTFLKKNQMTPKYSAARVKELVATGKVKPTAIFDYLFDANEALFNTPIIGAEVYRSDDAGKSWKKMNKKPLPMFNTYGYYFGRIFISPVNDGKLVIAGFTIDLSTDSGRTFKSIGKNNTHADHHVCWINPNKDSHFIIGNDGGVNITYDNGAHWFKANTPAVGQFYAITTDNAKPYRVYGGLQDNGVWVGNTARQRVNDGTNGDTMAYKSLGGGDGMQVQVDTRDNRTTYSGSQFGFYGRTHVDTGGYLGIYPRNDLGEESFRFNWQTPIVLSKHNQDVLYYATNRFHRSLNKGTNMQTLSGDLTNGKKEGDVPFGTATTIAESPMKFGLLYLGTDDGNIHVSKDGGYTWTKINVVLPKIPQGLYVSRVTPGAFKEGRVYVSLNGLRNDHFAPYLFVSDDFGTTWKQIGKDLPQESINVIKEDPKSDSILYAGTDGGLYVSIDAGNTWMAWTKGIPYSIPVHDIAIQQRDNEIVLGTHGRSLYVAPLKDIQALKGIITKEEKKPERRRSDDDDEIN
ncbi:MAG: glycosyl hydrolase [Bacteroidota bacterium]